MADPRLLEQFGCMVCFHDPHPDAVCTADDEYLKEVAGQEVMCGCDEPVSFEARMNRPVTNDQRATQQWKDRYGLQMDNRSLKRVQADLAWRKRHGG